MSRDHALDATRTFAIWMMVACHVARLINKKGFQFGQTTETHSNLRKTFARLDTDSSKSLSQEEFGALFPNESSETIASLFSTCDTSQSALLTYKEFYYGADKVIENYNVMGPVKSALESAARYMAWELGRKGIRVHAVSPGPLETRAASGIKDFDELLDRAADEAPAGRLVSIEDVGIACASLATDAARLITGETVYIDGGLHIMG